MPIFQLFLGPRDLSLNLMRPASHFEFEIPAVETSKQHSYRMVTNFKVEDLKVSRKQTNKQTYNIKQKFCHAKDMDIKSF